jgi:hypothetical protein
MMKLNFYKIGVVILILATPFLAFTQPKESSFGVYYGLNEYFQGTPIVRKYQNSGDQSLTRLQNNFGLTYHRFNTNNFISCDLNFASASYRGVSKIENFPILTPLHSSRMFFNLEFTLGKRKRLSERFELLYGVGPNFRIGYEDFLMQILPFDFWTELRFQRIFRFDPGLHLNTKIFFQVSDRFSMFAALNFSTSPFLVDRKNWNRSNEYFLYENNSTIRPARLDLSLRLGLNIKFNK